jgi:HD-like signal output (HDOD) protein
MLANAQVPSTVERFLIELRNDLEQDRLPLPSFPDVARKARQLVEDPDSSSVEIAKLISTDAVLSSRLLQVANSAFFRGLARTDTVQNAVTRLGRVCVRNLVVSLTMSQLFQPAKMQRIRPFLNNVWAQSTLIAATSQVLAQRLTKLDPAEAMLGGLVHNIGALPVLVRYCESPDLLPDPKMLPAAIDQLSGVVGARVLKKWEFPAILAQIPIEHLNLKRHHDGPSDYVDVVTVAVLHNRIGTQHPHAKANWAEIPALQKLDLTAEKSIQIIKDTRAEIASVQRMLR